MRYTRKEHEEYMNGVPVPIEDRKSEGGRIPDSAKLGTWMRRNDPIAFEVSWRECAADYRCVVGHAGDFLR